MSSLLIIFELKFYLLLVGLFVNRTFPLSSVIILLDIEKLCKIPCGESRGGKSFSF